MRKLALSLTIAFAVACAGGSEADLRRRLNRTSGVVVLPAGVIEVSGELVLPEGARDLEIRGAASGTTLRAADGFRGRAIFAVKSGTNIRFRDFSIDGNRGVLETRTGLPPSNVPFVGFGSAGGIVADRTDGLTISGLKFRNIAGFAVLVARASKVLIDRVEIDDSGSRNAKGRNNTTGGILLEEGTRGFQVRNCVFRNVRGNGVWTHSLYTSPRNADGAITGNRFDSIGRDAIQVGHATRVRVEGNSGRRIGYPNEEVDAEGGGIPVAIDTAGNVDRTVYAGNAFEEVKGKCIGLDGFHHGKVVSNRCVNRSKVEDYPFGHYGIVFNNSNPDMRSEDVEVSGNEIAGAKFGGIFVIGTGHRIARNRLRNLNTAHCNESGARFNCLYFADQPELLQAGIYLGRGAEHAAIARGNIVEDNEISGWKMKSRCLAAAPGVSLAGNTLRGNRCSDETTPEK